MWLDVKLFIFHLKNQCKMQYLVREITSDLIKNITISSKNCTFKDGCKLETNGKATLDFGLSNIEEIEIIAKKISGNGNLTIISNDIITNVTIHSKLNQSVFIKSTSSQIIFSRPEKSNGELIINGIKLFSFLKKTGDILATNWKSLIAKCGKYFCLRLVDNRLFATNGAYIEDGSAINLLETDPPNSFIKEENKIKFITSCEIVNLTLMDNIISISSSQNIFTHLDAPMPIVTPTPVTNSIITRAPSFLTNNKYVPIPTGYTMLVYDSSLVQEFNPGRQSNNKNVKFLPSNGQNFMVLKRGNFYNFSVSFLKPDTEYAIIVTLKKIHGNGKIKVEFINSSSQAVSSEATFMGSSSLEDVVSIIKTTSSFDMNMNYFSIKMSDQGLGEVIVSRIQILTSSDGKDINTVTENYIYNTTTVSNVKYIPTVYNEKDFVIVIPSYNNIKWCDKNILSVINQNSNNYRVIFTDDKSSDGTFEKVEEIVKKSGKADKITLIKNEVRLGALHNLYNMIHSCNDDEIILTLDGDDWLSDENVINKLQQVYSSSDVWMTYGQYQNYPDGGKGIAQRIPENVVTTNSFRNYTWCSSHLRTFYSWLFKRMAKKDFLYNNDFYLMSWDMVIMFPMLEMSSGHSRYIDDILYIYNLDNPINDHKVNIQLQQNLDRYIRGLPKYQPTTSPIFKKSVGLLIIATAKYVEFIQGLISSADNYFLKDCDVTYYIFSDQISNINSKRPIVNINIEHRPFPFASADRFKHFVKNQDKFINEDYLYYVDVDCLFVDTVGREILGNLVGVQHCGYYKMNGPYEFNTISTSYVEPSKYKTYFGGGFQGGKREKYLKLAQWCYDALEKDLTNGHMPYWHDESVLNKYFSDTYPSIVLSPSYHYPADNLHHYKAIWGNEVFFPKILLLKKNHKNIRE